MAITVTVTFSQSDVQSGQRVAGLVNVNNTGSAPVAITALTIVPSKPNFPMTINTPYAFNTPPVAGGAIPGGGGVIGGGSAGAGNASPVNLPNVVNNGTSKNYPFDCIAHNQVTPGSPSLVVEVVAAVTLSDGTITTAKAGFSVSANSGAPGGGLSQLNHQSGANADWFLLLGV